MDSTETEWYPAQDIPKQTVDLRQLSANTARGFKVGASSTANTTATQPAVKRKRSELAVGKDDSEMQTEVVSPDLKKMRQTSTRDVIGVTSNRSWKVPAGKRHSAQLGKPKVAWEAKVWMINTCM